MVLSTFLDRRRKGRVQVTISGDISIKTTLNNACYGCFSCQQGCCMTGKLILCIIEAAKDPGAEAGSHINITIGICQFGMAPWCMMLH